ncbi:hypothetical protein LJC31_00080 [Synergistaceae bacterium OttesenSCG-928-I11]|nr:hypothetical protein [Synergistaceae bacterium OttesenSCG-928-I11]
MTTEKQKKTYVFLLSIVVVLLLAAQFFLQHTFENTSAELARTSGNLEALKKTADARYALLDKYKSFESLAAAPGKSTRAFPENALELFAVVDRAMKDNRLEHTNRSSSSGTEPGGVLQLQIAFSGPYYGVMKALATLRESEYVMRISDFRITAESDGKVSGSMTILSNAKQG